MSDQQSQVPAPIQAAPPEKKRNSGVGCLILIAVVVLIAISIYSCGSNYNKNQPPEEAITRPNGERVDKYLAQVLCENKIKDMLVSPTSAKFGRPEWVKTANRWKVTSTLDSQNSFGAMIRSEWVCILDGTDDTIRVDQTR